ncbi:MAG TPA: EamA family transporter [Anaerolineae bacterium]|nr:EamA family transporter [Anaerolineae bacterium]
MLSIIYGLLSAFTWGAGDFTGGLAARKVGAVQAVFYASIVGLIAVSIVAFISNESLPSLQSWVYAMIAGIFGMAGLTFLYFAMANGTMSIAAPVSAVLAATLPVLIGIITEGLPEFLTLIGFGFALFAMWMVSQSENGVKDIFSHLSDLKLPLLAGIGFGLYFIVMHEATSDGALFWTMVASRVTSVLFLFIYMLIKKISFRINDTSSFPVIGLNGILDLTGNGFFILAGQAGRLDVASVLSSLYPGSTVLLAWIFLKERLTRNQWVGVISALIAIILMTI